MFCSNNNRSRSASLLISRLKTCCSGDDFAGNCGCRWRLCADDLGFGRCGTLVSRKADVGVSFDSFFPVAKLRGGGSKRHLWIVSIEAHAWRLFNAPPVYFKGELCGKVTLVLFSVEGCVDVSYGKENSIAPITPDLVANCWLKGFAPVIFAWQAGDRPEDFFMPPDPPQIELTSAPDDI